MTVGPCFGHDGTSVSVASPDPVIAPPGATSRSSIKSYTVWQMRVLGFTMLKSECVCIVAFQRSPGWADGGAEGDVGGCVSTATIVPVGLGATVADGVAGLSVIADRTWGVDVGALVDTAAPHAAAMNVNARTAGDHPQRGIAGC